MGKLSAIVAGIAVFPALASLYLPHGSPWLISAALWQASLVGFTVAIAASDALCERTTFLMGKRSDGCFGAISHVVFWPYFLGLRIKLFMGQRLSSEPLWHKITPGWYLGGWPESTSVLPPGKPSVLDVTCELPRRHPNKYLCLKVWDTQAPSVTQISAGVEWCLNEQRQGRPVYIHCAHGHGRSATLMCACFLQMGTVKDMDEAISLLKSVRPKVRMSARQCGALERWYAKRLEARMSDGEAGGGADLMPGGRGKDSPTVTTPAVGHIAIPTSRAEHQINAQS